MTATSEESFESFRDALEPEESRRIQYLKADFSQPESLDRLINDLQELPRLDVLVNNAGTNINNELGALKIEDYDLLHAVNLRASILLMQTSSEKMRQRNWGRIVNIVSIWSIVTRAGRIAYTATKFGLAGATMTAAVDLAKQGILVNAVSPGFILTELTARTLNHADIEELSAKIPMGRFADPDEIAGIVLFLCSHWNTYITGQNIVVDGGYTIV